MTHKKEQVTVYLPVFFYWTHTDKLYCLHRCYIYNYTLSLIILFVGVDNARRKMEQKVRLLSDFVLINCMELFIISTTFKG